MYLVKKKAKKNNGFCQPCAEIHEYLLLRKTKIVPSYTVLLRTVLQCYTVLLPILLRTGKKCSIEKICGNSNKEQRMKWFVSGYLSNMVHAYIMVQGIAAYNSPCFWTHF